MAKKKIMNKPMEKPVCNYSRGCLILVGIVFVVLGIWAYVDINNLNLIVAVALILLGAKKICMAAKRC